jgi:hypothetical protein
MPKVITTQILSNSINLKEAKEKNENNIPSFQAQQASSDHGRLECTSGARAPG